MNVLIPYASIHASTTEIAAYMAGIIAQHGLVVTFAQVDTITDLAPHDVILPGSPIQCGMWVRPMMSFLRRAYPILQHKLVYPWLACVRVLEPGGYKYVLENYLPPEVLRLAPASEIGVFAGKMDALAIDHNDRWNFALHYDGYETLTRMHGDFRDWDTIREWTEGVIQQITVRQAIGV